MAGKGVSVSFDEARFAWLVRQKAVAAVEEAAEHFVRVMEKEVLMEMNSHDGPYTSDWRKHMSNNMRILAKSASDTEIEFLIGLDPSLYQDLGDLMKSMIVTEGSGSAVGGPPVMIGPRGRMVWSRYDDMQQQAPSLALNRVARLAPKGFNEIGNQWVEATIEIIKKELGGYLNRAMENITEAEFASCWRVS